MNQDELAAIRRTGRTLWCPFESRMNAHVQHAHEESLAWARAHRLVVGERALRKFDAARFAWLTARAYPTAASSDLALVAEWNVWLFVHDDGCDTAPHGRDPEALVELYEGLRAVLHGRAIPTATTAAAGALAELMPRILARGSASWRRRFVDAVDAYFASCVWEANNRASGRVPAVDEYVTMRRDTGAVRTSIAMIEICESGELPDELLADSHVQALADACNDVVCWANDIMSLPKELAERDVHNLVVVVERERFPGEIVRAATLAMDMHDGRVADFIRTCASVPACDPPTDAKLARFVDTMRAWMIGNLEWARESGRYVTAPTSRRRAHPSRATRPTSRDPRA
jgi:hypothetical protein